MSLIIKYSSRVPEGMTFSSLRSVWWEMDYTHSLGWNLGLGKRSMPSVCSRVTILPEPSRLCSLNTHACDIIAYDTTVSWCRQDRNHVFISLQTRFSELSQADQVDRGKAHSLGNIQRALWEVSLEPPSFSFTIKWSSTTKPYSIWPKLTSPSWLFPNVSCKEFKFTTKSQISMEVLSSVSFVSMVMASGKPHTICRGELDIGTK